VRSALDCILCCALLLATAACVPLRSSIKPPYLVNGQQYDEQGIREFAASQCKAADAQPAHPLFPFTTDGCSLWPDGSWRQCCLVHDVSYWCGGPSARAEVDRELRSCVTAVSNRTNAFLMYAGIRLGGSRWLPFPWRWGYGYDWPYRKPVIGEQ
jgi:hypothetical protein